MGLQAAQSERESVQAEQVQVALDTKVGEVQAALREEMEGEVRSALEAADKELQKRLRAQRRGEEAAEKELRDALEMSRHALHTARSEQRHSEHRMAGALAEQQQRVEHQEQVIPRCGA